MSELKKQKKTVLFHHIKNNKNGQNEPFLDIKLLKQDSWKLNQASDEIIDHFAVHGFLRYALTQKHTHPQV